MIKKTNILKPIATLSPDQEKFWDVSNKNILWGWKRNSKGLKRLVYFRSSLTKEKNNIFLGPFYFLYSTTLPVKDSKNLIETLELVKEKFSKLDLPVSFKKEVDDKLITISLGIGETIPDDFKKIKKLTSRKPKKHIKTASSSLLIQSPLENINHILPADLYLGSGVSYESGILMAYQVHDMFLLDNYKTGDFTVGKDDEFPSILLKEGMGRFNKFATVHIQALKTKPSESMQIVAKLYKAGLIKKVFTDNVDNLLSKLEIPFERVRGSGIYNERYNAKFDTKNLIVVGVGADRRQIVRQARGKHMKIIVVNPIGKVSLKTTHLEYLKKADLFYQMTAKEFFSKLKKNN